MGVINRDYVVKRVAPQDDDLFPLTISNPRVDVPKGLYLVPYSVIKKTLSSGGPSNYKGDWLAGTDYVLGDIVRSGGNYWICSVAHTSVLGNPPTASSLAWRGLGGANVEEWAFLNNTTRIPLDKLPTNIATGSSIYKGDWAAGDFSEGDITKDGADFFIAGAAKTSADTTRPSLDDDWKQIDATLENVENWALKNNPIRIPSEKLPAIEQFFQDSYNPIPPGQGQPALVGKRFNSSSPRWESEIMSPSIFSLGLKHEASWDIRFLACFVAEAVTGTAEVEVKFRFTSDIPNQNTVEIARTLSFPLTDGDDWPSVDIKEDNPNLQHYQHVQLILEWQSGVDVVFEAGASDQLASTEFGAKLIPIGNQTTTSAGTESISSSEDLNLFLSDKKNVFRQGIRAFSYRNITGGPTGINENFRIISFAYVGVSGSYDGGAVQIIEGLETGKIWRRETADTGGVGSLDLPTEITTGWVLRHEPGAGGSGLPAGGTAGQALFKKSASDGDAEWANSWARQFPQGTLIEGEYRVSTTQRQLAFGQKETLNIPTAEQIQSDSFAHKQSVLFADDKILKMNHKNSVTTPEFDFINLAEDEADITTDELTLASGVSYPSDFPLSKAVLVKNINGKVLVVGGLKTGDTTSNKLFELTIVGTEITQIDDKGVIFTLGNLNNQPTDVLKDGLNAEIIDNNLYVAFSYAANDNNINVQVGFRVLKITVGDNSTSVVEILRTTNALVSNYHRYKGAYYPFILKNPTDGLIYVYFQNWTETNNQPNETTIRYNFKAWVKIAVDNTWSVPYQSSSTLNTNTKNLTFFNGSNSWFWNRWDQHLITDIFYLSDKVFVEWDYSLYNPTASIYSTSFLRILLSNTNVLGVESIDHIVLRHFKTSEGDLLATLVENVTANAPNPWTINQVLRWKAQGDVQTIVTRAQRNAYPDLFNQNTGEVIFKGWRVVQALPAVVVKGDVLLLQVDVGENKAGFYIGGDTIWIPWAVRGTGGGGGNILTLADGSALLLSDGSSLQLTG